MSISRPSKPQLRALAEPLGFHLEEGELETLHAVFEEFAIGFDVVEALPEPERRPPPQREYRMPEAEENPYGAWGSAVLPFVSRVRGRLKGRRVVIKDNIALAGVPMQGGAKFLEGYVPEEDATVVRRVLDEGAEIVGKGRL